MSITSAMYTGVSGLKSNGDAMNVIGNNISNVNTIGFKAGRTVFSDMLSANIGNNSQIGRGVQVQKVDNIFGQSSFQTTELTTDLAIQGDSLFALAAPDTNSAVTATDAYYTRAGDFRVNKDGYLVNPDDYQVLDEARTPIKFDPTTFGQITKIDSTGTITYLDNTGTQLVYDGQDGPGTGTAVKLGVALVPDRGMLEKIGGTLYRAGADTGITDASIAAANGTSERLNSNSLELSNVDMASEFVNMITTQRAYSANSKTITSVDQMTQEVLNIIR
jgi:flagellar hook protein FlgE